MFMVEADYAELSQWTDGRVFCLRTMQIRCPMFTFKLLKWSDGLDTRMCCLQLSTGGVEHDNAEAAHPYNTQTMTYI